MDELERAWVRNRAEAHYRATRTPIAGWRQVAPTLLSAFVAFAERIGSWLIS